MWALATVCQEPGGERGKLPPSAPEGHDSSQLKSPASRWKALDCTGLPRAPCSWHPGGLLQHLAACFKVKFIRGPPLPPKPDSSAL